MADGGWGTELFKRGLKPGQAPEMWNIDRPEDIRAVAAAYVTAGAEIILTNTFGGSPMKLAKMGLGSKMAEINWLGTRSPKTQPLAGPRVRIDGTDRRITEASWRSFRRGDGQILRGTGQGPGRGRCGWNRD